MATSFNKAALLAAIIAASIILAGCTGGKSGKGSSLPEVYSGTGGIDAYFAPESVPSRTVSGSSSDLFLLVSNKGAVDADLSKTTVVVRDSRGHFNFNKPILDLNDRRLYNEPADGEVPLKGRASTGNVGSINSLVVEAKARGFLKDEHESKESGFQAQVCYAYETRLTANVCIDTSPTSISGISRERRPCVMEKPILLQSQGAPVAVKRIEAIKTVDKIKDPAGNPIKVVRPRFSVFISNVGNGAVTNPDDPRSYCVLPESGNEKNKDARLNRVVVERVSLLGNDLTCDKEKALTGKLESDFVVCDYPWNNIQEGSGVFATPISVFLRYGYSSTSDPVPVIIDAARNEQVDLPCVSGQTKECQTSYGAKGSQTCVSGEWGICIGAPGSEKTAPKPQPTPTPIPASQGASAPANPPPQVLPPPTPPTVPTTTK